jgi:hypothetical protein
MAGLCHKARHKSFLNSRPSLVPTRSGIEDCVGYMGAPPKVSPPATTDSWIHSLTSTVIAFSASVGPANASRLLPWMKPVMLILQSTSIVVDFVVAQCYSHGQVRRPFPRWSRRPFLPLFEKGGAVNEIRRTADGQNHKSYLRARCDLWVCWCSLSRCFHKLIFGAFSESLWTEPVASYRAPR